MADNTLNTKIILKHGLDSNWDLVNPVLENGEAGVYSTKHPSSELGTYTSIKIGDGTKHFKDLAPIGAKAIDVHSWAKQPNKPTYSTSEISGIENYVSLEYLNTFAADYALKTSLSDYALKTSLNDYVLKSYLDTTPTIGSLGKINNITYNENRYFRLPQCVVFIVEGQFSKASDGIPTGGSVAKSVPSALRPKSQYGMWAFAQKTDNTIIRATGHSIEGERLLSFFTFI